VKDENGDLLSDSHNILNRRKNSFSQLLNACNVSHTDNFGRLEVEIAIAKLKKYKSPGSDEILAELIQAGSEISCEVSAIHKLINSVWNREELPDQWKESIIVQVHRNGDKTDCNNYGGISLLSKSYKIISNII
jgi:hypothetical protein